MRLRVNRWIVNKLIDFGLFVLSLGPKGPEDREYEKKFIALWREWNLPRPAERSE